MRTQIKFSSGSESYFSDVFDLKPDKLFSSSYYALGLQLNYSLEKIAGYLNYDFLKNTEIFLNSSFVSGYVINNLKNYIYNALGDITTGFIVPVYKGERFFSDFSLSFMPHPLSKLSRDIGLSKKVDGTISLLYFLTRSQKWNWVFSSDHNIGYRYYTKALSDELEIRRGVVWSTNQGKFIFRQSFNKYLPSNTGMSIGHGFTKSSIYKYHTLELAIAFSWKLQDQFYLHSSLGLRDDFLSYIKDAKDRYVLLKDHGVGKYDFFLSASYSF